MSGYGSIYGGYYGGRGPARQNEAWMRPSWNTKYNGFGSYGGYGEDYNGFGGYGGLYNGAYGSYGGAYGGYGLPGYGAVPPGYGAGLSLYGAGGPTYATTPPMMYPPNYVANSATLPAQMQQPGASAAQSVPPLYPNNFSGSQGNNPPTTGITNPAGGWPPQ